MDVATPSKALSMVHRDHSPRERLNNCGMLSISPKTRPTYPPGISVRKIKMRSGRQKGARAERNGCKWTHYPFAFQFAFNTAHGLIYFNVTLRVLKSGYNRGRRYVLTQNSTQSHFEALVGLLYPPSYFRAARYIATKLWSSVGLSVKMAWSKPGEGDNGLPFTSRAVAICCIRYISIHLTRTKFSSPSVTSIPSLPFLALAFVKRTTQRPARTGARLDICPKSG